MSSQSPAIRVYLDTNVLLDVIHERQPASQVLFERIRGERWPAVASPFAIAEMLEAEHTEAWAAKLFAQGFTFSYLQRAFNSRRVSHDRLTTAEIDAVQRNLGARLSPVRETVTFPVPTADLLDRVVVLCGSSNIETTDAVHVATALSTGCTLFVTGDRELAQLAGQFIHVARPPQFDQAVRTLGRR